jgi:hypothetical protein
LALKELSKIGTEYSAWLLNNKAEVNLNDSTLLNNISSYDKSDAKKLMQEPEIVLIPGQYYKIQIAFIDFNDVIGYYSNVGVIKCTT